MKKLLLATIILMPATASAQTSNAQLNSFLTNQATQMGNAYAKSATTSMTSSGTSGDMSVQQFNTLKSQTVATLNGQISRLQSEQRCAQNAQTPETLKGCVPAIASSNAMTQTETNMTNQGTNMLTQYGTSYLRR